MDTLACIQAWLIWQEHNEQQELPDIPLSSITGLVILIVLLTCPFNLHPAFAAELLARGSRGQQVVKLQDDLKEAGCFPEGVRSTGYYGKITKSAVTQLQKTHGLRVDGVVGEQTRSALDSGKICQSLATSGLLKMGSRGQNVIQLQVQLNDLGFKVQKIDGIFGKETRGAVIQFQRSNGLKPDGIVGSKTAKVLLESPVPDPKPDPPVTDTPVPPVTDTPVPPVTDTPVPPVTDTPVPPVTDPKPDHTSIETYEKALKESVSEWSGIQRISLENFKIIKSAIIDNNLAEEYRDIQYNAAIILARQIYLQNLDEFSSNNLYQTKKCQSLSCIDREDVYKTDVFKEENSQQTEKIGAEVFESMKSLFAQAINEANQPDDGYFQSQQIKKEDQSGYGFMAAFATAYLREPLTENIIKILKSALETQTIEGDHLTDEDIEFVEESLKLFREYDQEFFAAQKKSQILDPSVLTNFLKEEASRFNALESRGDIKNPYYIARYQKFYEKVYSYSSMLILVGEEKLVINEFDRLITTRNSNKRQQLASIVIELAIADSLYDHIKNNDYKTKSSQAIIMSISKNNPQTISCIIAIGSLKKIREENPQVKNIISQIPNPDSNYCRTLQESGWAYIYQLLRRSKY